MEEMFSAHAFVRPTDCSNVEATAMSAHHSAGVATSEVSNSTFTLGSGLLQPVLVGSK